MLALLPVMGMVALEYSVAAHVLVGGTHASTGQLMAHFNELMAGAGAVPGGPFLQLAVILALPGVLITWLLYLLHDLMADRLNLHTGNMHSWLFG